MRANYEKGGYGYGHAKQELFETIIETYGEIRDRYWHYMSHKDEIDASLAVGAEKAKKVADDVLNRVRIACGY